MLTELYCLLAVDVVVDVVCALFLALDALEFA